MPSTIAYTYNTLIAELQDFLEDSGTEYVATLPEMVALGETRLYSDLNLEIFDGVDTGTLTASQREQAIKGTNWQGTRTLHITVSGDEVYLERRSYEYCVDYAPDPTVEAAPIYYAELNATEFYMVPTPDTTYAYTLRKITKPDALTSGNQNTWLGDEMGDILLYSCLLASEQYLKSTPEQIKGWADTYISLIGPRKLELRRVARADYDPVKDAATTIASGGGQ